MPNELDDLMTETLVLDVDPKDPNKFLLGGATFVHRDRIDQIPGSRFVGRGDDYWTVPRTWVTAKVIRRLFPGKVTWTGEAQDWANDMWTGIIEPSLMLRNEGAKPEWIEAITAMVPDERKPRDYQVSGAIFLATARRAILLDEQGTGKMTQVAMALNLYPETKPCLVVSPKSTIYTWQRELALFGIKSIVIDGSDSAAKRREMLEAFDPEDTPVCITTYTMVPKHSRVNGYGKIKLSAEDKLRKELNQIAWQTVILDEAQKIKDPTTAQARACWAVSETAPFRWATTGTPTESSIIDFWSVLHFIDPVEWPSKTKYIDNWVMTYTNHFGGMEVLGLRPDNEQEFRDITEWHWRRVKAGEGLPPRDFMDVHGILSAKERAVYKAMAKSLMAEIGTKDEGDLTKVLFAENHMVKAGRLMQAASATLVFDEDEHVRMVEPSSKLDLLAERLEANVGVPTILWFKNRDLLHMQEARFDKAEVPYVSIHGDITGRDRDDNMQAFQSGEVDYILCTISAANEGVTLTRAPLAIFVQREYSYLMQTQAPFRNWRIGSEQHDMVRYETLIMKGTVEEELNEQLSTKAAAAQELTGD